ncbi:hypothetical protein FisN_15Lu345 [Fistulifera solaris]|uniref:Uncharacterized protein n=1 Tax=Fistulifera solaris TaxID=1519565 RepID=A0A1Z5JZH6_FISSO|nr:hypothetical protein FisN_15Lu345 [Fistulifera solaris]|eukprot:GAX19171.1 hypothetical protein FisN_15Lu345 [Fistulifera solaris]
MIIKLIAIISIFGATHAQDSFSEAGTGSKDDITVDSLTIPPSDLATDISGLDLALSDPMTGYPTETGSPSETSSPTETEPPVDLADEDVEVPDVSVPVEDVSDKDSTSDATTDSKPSKDMTTSHHNDDKDDAKDSKDNGGSSGLTCGTCSAETPGDCVSWIYSPTFSDYRVFNFICGCANRITPESQCLRFADDGIAGVEEFAVNECGVHLRCDVVDFDPEPGSHSCTGICPVGFGCFARCSTSCAYNIACTVIKTV